VAVVGRLVQKLERDCTKGETIDKAIQKKHRIHNIENKNTKRKNKHENNTKIPSTLLLVLRHPSNTT
jgi:hypothetical protein